jgi:FkbM family methyltransferase
MYGATGNFYLGLHEFQDMAFACHLLKPNDLFVDIGSNVGSYAVLAAGVAGASVLAYEPAHETAEVLIDNVRLNRLEALVSVRTLALGAQPGTAHFTTDLDTVNHVVVDGDEVSTPTTCVEVVTLDDELDGRTPVLMKIDVEGCEGPVLDGASRILQSPHLLALIVELNGQGERFGYPDAAVRARLEHHGFRAVHYDPYTRVLTPVTRESAQKRISDNTIFVRDGELVSKRLTGAPRFEALGQMV